MLQTARLGIMTATHPIPTNPNEGMPMNKTWILVAHRAGARIFENDGPGTGLRPVDTITHPEGRLANKALGSDTPGRSFDSHGANRHALGKEHDPVETVAQEFARALAARLDAGRTKHAYGKLVLVAEPRFLGMLRAALPPHTATLVSATLDRDLGGTADHDLPSHLGAVVRL